MQNFGRPYIKFGRPHIFSNFAHICRMLHHIASNRGVEIYFSTRHIKDKIPQLQVHIKHLLDNVRFNHVVLLSEIFVRNMYTSWKYKCNDRF